MNNLAHTTSLTFPGSGQFDIFLTYFIKVYKGVIKVDKREILTLYFKHICVLFLPFVFPGQLLLLTLTAFSWKN